MPAENGDRRAGSQLARLVRRRLVVRSRNDSVPVSMIEASNVKRSTIAAQSRGSVKMRFHSLNAELLAIAMLGRSSAR